MSLAASIARRAVAVHAHRPCTAYAAPARRTLLLVALGALGGCAASWQPLGTPAPAPPAPGVPAPLPSDVRLTVTGWAEPVLVHGPQVVGDSLVGTRVAQRGATNGPRVAVPLAAVSRLEAAEADAAGSFLLVIVGLLGLGLIVAKVVAGSIGS